MAASLLFLALLYLLLASHGGDDRSGADNSAPGAKAGKPSQSHLLSQTGPFTGAVVEGPPKQQQKQKIQNLTKLPLRDQIAYNFPYDVESKFPAYIWQTWKYTPASPKFGDKMRAAEASWTEKHRDFVHEVCSSICNRYCANEEQVITDNVALHLIRHLYVGVPKVVEAYEALPLPILKADFFRYLILLARGGIYSDIDTQALQPASEWIPPSFKPQTVGLVVGIEADPDRPDWAMWYSRRIQFCQWTIQSKPGHPVLREIVANITMETLHRKARGTLRKDMDKVVDWTGPAVWTDTVFQYFNDPLFFEIKSPNSEISWKSFTGIKAAKKVGDVVVLPITSFSPGIGHSGSGEYDDPMAFVKHEFEGITPNVQSIPHLTIS